MGFLTPLMLILGGTVMAGIVAMYLLRLRREEQTVSSTFLWQQLVRDVEANAPWQKLRHSWLFWLQLLAALVLGLAVARPFFKTAGVSGKNLILIIDRSASMSATDVAENRLAAAKAQAVDLVDQLPDGARATVIAVGGELDVPAAATTDRRELRDAIGTLDIRIGGGSDLEQALSLAGALAARESDSEVAILSDGQVTVPTSATIPAKIRYFPIGTSTNNQAIASVTLNELAPDTLTFFARVRNEGQERVTRRLVLTLDGAVFNAYDLELVPGQDQTINIDVPASAQLVEAHLEGSDALPLDDRAWALRPSADPIPVRFVTPGNRFIATALGLMPRVEVTAYLTETATFTDTPVMTILDASLPDPLPDGNLLIIAPYRSTEYFSVTGVLEQPLPRPAPTDDPLLRNVELGEVNVFRSTRIENAAWSHTVIDSTDGALLIAGEIDGRRIAVLGFDVHESDLPLNIAFPVLMSNLIGYLAPGSGGESAFIKPDEPLAIPVASTITRAEVTFPSGAQQSIEVDRGTITVPSDAINSVGIYEVALYQASELQTTQRYIVNGYSPEEATIAPIPVLDIMQVDGAIVGSLETEQDQAGKDEWWQTLALIAFIVLVLEWIVAQRSALTRLRLWWQTRRA